MTHGNRWTKFDAPSLTEKEYLAGLISTYMAFNTLPILTVEDPAFQQLLLTWAMFWATRQIPTIDKVDPPPKWYVGPCRRTVRSNIIAAANQFLSMATDELKKIVGEVQCAGAPVHVVRNLFALVMDLWQAPSRNDMLAV